MALNLNFAYAQLAIHRWMLRDKVRNEAYRKAIMAIVKPGDVVIDVGAGSGILSIFAAQAGARKVYAVERTGIARLAQMMIEANGVGDRVEIIQSDLEDIDLPEKANVIVSEWMGGLGVDENMLPPVVMARDRFLVPGGRARRVACKAARRRHDADCDNDEQRVTHDGQRHRHRRSGGSAPANLDTRRLYVSAAHRRHLVQRERQLRLHQGRQGLGSRDLVQRRDGRRWCPMQCGWRAQYALGSAALAAPHCTNSR